MNAIPTLAERAATAEAATSEWSRRAACNGRSRLMDPPAGLRTKTAIESARSICRSCPVLDECRAWVLGLSDSADPGGVCAAMTEAERSHARAATEEDEPRKRCSSCRAVLPLTEFYRDARSHDGRQSTCAPCQRDDRNTYYHARKGH